MQPNLPSLGSTNSAPLKRVHEVFDLPSGRPNIVSRVERILALGGVQKIIIELGHPIKVDRLVASEEDVEDAPDDDLMSSIRNGEMQEFPKNVKSPFIYLFQAFHLLSQKRLKPSVMLVHRTEELRDWLSLEAFLDLRELFGVEVKAHPEIPDLTALLVASNPDNPHVISLALRLVLDKDKENEADSGKSLKERDRR